MHPVLEIRDKLYRIGMDTFPMALDRLAIFFLDNERRSAEFTIDHIINKMELKKLGRGRIF